MTSAIKRILIIRTDRIGDVVLTTPVFKALRSAFPEAFLSVMVTPTTRALVDGNPNIDEVLVDDRRGVHRGMAGFWRLVRLVRGRRFDLVFNFHSKRRMNLLCFLAAIPRRVGFGQGKNGFLMTDQVRDDRAKGLRHESDYVLELLAAAGVSVTEKEFFIPLQNEAEEWCVHLWRDLGWAGRKIIAVHPGASCLTRCWPPDYFSVVLEQITRRPDYVVVLIGTKETQAIARQIQSTSGGVIDLTGQTSLAQMCSFLKRCDLLISNDSGPVHVADALGVPVVAIFTRNQPGINPERWRPLGPRSRVLAPAVQFDIDFSKGKIPDSSFLRVIQPADVIAVVDDLLDLPPQAEKASSLR